MFKLQDVRARFSADAVVPHCFNGMHVSEGVCLDDLRAQRRTQWRGQTLVFGGTCGSVPWAGLGFSPGLGAIADSNYQGNRRHQFMTP
jgi:hypothetical protein